MNFAKHAVIALAPAAPGWTVAVTDLTTGAPVTCPIVAWASVVTGYDSDADPQTEVHPVFVAGGQTWTGPEYPMGPTPVINGPAS